MNCFSKATAARRSPVISEDQFPKYLAALGHPATDAMTIPVINDIRERKEHLTRTIEQVSGNLFYDYEATPLWREANVGTLLLSGRPIDDRCATGIGIYRKAGSVPFTGRESRIAHIILTEVPWLHEQGWPEDRGRTVPTLSPRQLRVLNLLLESRSRKEIAGHLGISENTVAGYVKEVFRHFRVHSQAELMRRFMQGDGADSISSARLQSTS